MSLNNYSYILLDSCFISDVYRIDKSCRLLDCFDLLSDHGCIIEKGQYLQGNCNGYCPTCTWLDDIFSDEDTLKANLEAKKLGIDFTHVAKDPADPKMFLWAYKTENSVVFTCDRNLLKLLRDHDISRLCFKASIKMLDGYCGGAIAQDFNVALMNNGDDPFFHYSTNGRCDSHCGLASSCECCNH